MNENDHDKELLERQENEICALKAIYGENCVDLRNLIIDPRITNKKFHHNKETYNPYVNITVYPLSSESNAHDYERIRNYAQVNLRVKCSSKYPNEVPKLTLENEKSMSKQQIKELHKQLVVKANECIGQEMIYELVSEIANYLYVNCKPPIEKLIVHTNESVDDVSPTLNKVASLHDQMLERLGAAYTSDASSDNDEHQHINNNELVEAIREKQKKLKEEIKKERMASKRERLSSSNYSLSIKSSESGSYDDQAPTNPTRATSSFTQIKIEFSQPTHKSVQCIKLIEGVTETKPYKIYRAFDLSTSDLLNVYEWSISLEKNKIFQADKLDYCLNEIPKIMDEFKRLVRLKNESLVNYIAYDYKKIPNKSVFLVQICMLYIEGTCLDIFIKQKHVLSYNTLKMYATELIKILEFLHSKDVFHRDLKASCVYLDATSGNLKLTDFSIIKRLNNVYEKCVNNASNFLSANKQTDYHQLGLMLLSLSLGELIDSYGNLKIPNTLQSDFKSFIYACIYGNNFDSIGNHEFLLETHQNSPRQLKSLKIDENDDKFDTFKAFNDYPSQSRLNTEFEVIGVVGEGAFGKVLKVKNKLDMRYYAIKRIRINPQSNELNKITREIKLLSRLNHENIVRYYATWVETSEENIASSKTNKTLNSDATLHTTPTTTTTTTTSKTRSSKLNKQNSLTLSDLVLTNNSKFFDNSVHFDCDDDFSSFSSSESMNNQQEDETSTSDSDEDDVQNGGALLNVNKINNDFDCIVFENEGDDLNETTSESEYGDDKDLNESLNMSSSNKIQRQFIYIQMEFCNGKTLKHLIDNKRLFDRQDQIWCLFREILQGLNHIHEQGMIHRDLKPTNVLIDDLGHAKIGDFGLATSKCFLLGGDTSQVNNPHQASSTLNQTSPHLASHDCSSQYDSHLTGTVGTSYYVAPELLTPSLHNRYTYTQKVDIYSLGIMFYEMCFELKTQMERDLVMINLRKTQIILPEFTKEFTKEHESQIVLIRTMLEHNPNNRPSAKELLRNELIPRKADEIVLDELLKYSLTKNNSTGYQKIIKAVFDQINSDKEDASYDSFNNKSFISHKYLQIREYVYNTLTRLFQKCGAFMLSYPLLMPWNNLCNDFNKAFQLVDSSGLVLTLPYNHRIQFARYVARSGCENIKRYFIGNVYQFYLEKLKLSGFHPKEKLEASFDIVTSNNCDFLPEVEILYVLNELIASLPELHDLEFRLVLNHTKLLNAILLHCGLKHDQHKDVYMILSEYTKQSKSQVTSKDNSKNWLSEKLRLLRVDENTVSKLINWLLKDGTLEQCMSDMKNLLKNNKNTEVVKLAKESLNQLKLITQYIQVFDLKYQLHASTSFVLPLMYHPYEHDGLIYQLLVKRKAKKTKFEYDILASGGRYDKLVKYFCIVKNDVKKRAIGVSIDFDKLVNLLDDKSKLSFRSHTIIFSHAPCTNTQQVQSTSNKLDQVPSLNLNIQDNLNRLYLFKYLTQLTSRNSPTSIYLLHEKFSTLDEMDYFCKTHSITSYVYIHDDGYVTNTHKMFINHSQASTPQTADLTPNKILFKIRSINERLKFNEKSFHLNEFLTNLSVFMQNNRQAFLINTKSSHMAPSLDTICSSIISNTSQNHVASSTTPNHQSSLNNHSQLNITILHDALKTQTTGVNESGSNTSNNNPSLNKRKKESQLIARLNHLFSIFSSRTRIEIIAIDTPDMVIQTLGSCIHLDCDEKAFRQSFASCYEKLNKKYEKQLLNYRLEDLLKDLRFKRLSKVFILCSLNGEYYKLMVAP